MYFSILQPTEQPASKSNPVLVLSTNIASPSSTTSSEHEYFINDFLTPSESSLGSDSMESSCTEDGHLDCSSHIKRPMNAFMLFSKANREKFKKLYPGKQHMKTLAVKYSRQAFTRELTKVDD